MGIDAEIAKVGASRLSASGLPIVTAVNPLGSGEEDVEHFGEIDLFCSLGMAALPPAATTNAHAEVVALRGVPGCTGLGIAGRAEGSADAYAMLHPGDTAQHATGPKHGAMLLTREDGRVTMLTSEDATTTGRTVFIEVSPDGQRFVGPWGKVTFGADGFHVRHYTGARIDIGGIGGSAMPGPLAALGAYCSLSAPIIRLEGAAVALGGSGPQDAVCKSTPLVVALTQLNVALGVLAGALPAIGAATAPSTASVAGAASTAIGLAIASIAAALPLLPSSSTTVT